MKTEHTARLAAEQTITEQQPLVVFARTCAKSKDTILIRELAKIACKGNVSTIEKRQYQKLSEWGLIVKIAQNHFRLRLIRIFCSFRICD